MAKKNGLIIGVLIDRETGLCAPVVMDAPVKSKHVMTPDQAYFVANRIAEKKIRESEVG